LAVLANPVPLQSVAIAVYPDDNVAVVREPVSAGTAVTVSRGEVVEIAAAIVP